VVEAAARDGVGGVPQAEDPVHVQEVGDEGAVLVPALAGVRGAKDGSELRQRRVHLGLLASQEGAWRRETGRSRPGPRRWRWLRLDQVGVDSI
jgi:hypothetical protein